MAHGTTVNDVAYGITGGKCLVGGTEYSIQKGRTLIGGTGYDIAFTGPTRIETTLSNGHKFYCYFTINGGEEKYYYTGEVLNFGAGEKVILNAYSLSPHHEILVDGVSDTENTHVDVDCSGYNVSVWFISNMISRSSTISITRKKWEDV